MAEEDQEALLERFATLLDAAFEGLVSEILARIKAGQNPRRRPEPSVSAQANGMPTISDGSYFSATGVFDYSTVLDPPYGDDEARKAGKYPRGGFPVVDALTDFVMAHPGLLPSLRETPAPLLEIWARLQVERAADDHFLKFGEVETTPSTRALILRPRIRGLCADRLELAIVVPIAMVRFDFDRMRLGPRTFITRMSNALQRARWEGKAYGANGHDSVLAAATHAFVLTGWGLDNSDWRDLASLLSRRVPEARDVIETLFAALRLKTGVATGYAQEVRLARRWRIYQRSGWPELFAVGSRHYPEAFDDFGWTQTELPLVTRAQMRAVSTLLSSMRGCSSKRLTLALRRMNAATIRLDDADAILDATIALEVLLGDPEGQAISWKLRMRAAALTGIAGTKSDMEAMRKAIGRIYDARSSIVHGSTSSRKKTADPTAERTLAIETLRSVLAILVENLTYLDPLAIDRDLLMAPASGRPDETA